MITQNMIVACRNANGEADVFICTIDVTEEDLELGNHYDLAEQMAEEEGYEAPYICFDESERKNLNPVVALLSTYQANRLELDAGVTKMLDEAVTLDKSDPDASEDASLLIDFPEWPAASFELKMARGVIWLQDESTNKAVTVIDDIRREGSIGEIVGSLYELYDLARSED